VQRHRHDRAAFFREAQHLGDQAHGGHGDLMEPRLRGEGRRDPQGVGR
jgi:hypothetical protein